MKLDWESVFKTSNWQIDLPFDRNNEKAFKSKGEKALVLVYVMNFQIKIEKFSS